ncbi:hypothetical protein ABZ128_35130 [Streptomyces sp. NPDC006326]|uniref:hypothetical protein n=1 Tax=Streptomyces sp. NPDC006326 TaxID=3156752 RepID=UPI0033AD96FA
MKPISRTVRIVVTDPRREWVHPHHATRYEILRSEEVARVLGAWPAGTRARAEHFACMCLDHVGGITLYEAGGQRVRSLDVPRTEELARLLDPADPEGIPAGHRERWVAAAPEELREYAGAMARGEEDPARPDAVDPGLVFSWLGAVRPQPSDAASVLAAQAPLRLLAGVPTQDLAWAVRETDRPGLSGAVRFFASEEFTTRHPKRRRVPDTARNLLLDHARSHRPADLKVLERRLLRAADDRVRRS